MLRRRYMKKEERKDGGSIEKIKGLEKNIIIEVKPFSIPLLSLTWFWLQLIALLVFILRAHDFSSRFLASQVYLSYTKRWLWSVKKNSLANRFAFTFPLPLLHFQFLLFFHSITTWASHFHLFCSIFLGTFFLFVK